MSWLAIEAFEETECGLEELETSHTMMNVVGQRKEKLVKTAAAVGFTVLTSFGPSRSTMMEEPSMEIRGIRKSFLRVP
jgi:phosphosulfolactate synthase (CoM biosynthesis protein A)